MDYYGDLVAVYGSLRKDGVFHAALRPFSQFMGYGLTKNRYAMYDLYFPMVVENEKVSKIKVEVYKIEHHSLMSSLDRIEGHPDLYRRKKIPVDIIGGKQEMCWMYFFNGKSHGTLIYSGDYLTK